MVKKEKIYQKDIFVLNEMTWYWLRRTPGIVNSFRDKAEESTCKSWTLETEKNWPKNNESNRVESFSSHNN